VGWAPRADVVQPDAHGLLRATHVGFRSVKLIARVPARVGPWCLQGCRSTVSKTPPLLNAGGILANGAQGRAELLEALYAAAALTGKRVYQRSWGWPGAIGVPMFLRSDRMFGGPGAGWLAGWPMNIAVGGPSNRFDVSGESAAICHIKNFHRRTIIMALARCGGGNGVGTCTRGVAAGAQALLRQRARPLGAIVYAGPKGQGQAERNDAVRTVLVSENGEHH